MAYANPEDRKSYGKRWRAENQDKQNEYARTWRKNNPEKQKELQRKASLKKLYGITLEEYDALSEAQNHVCAICKLPEQRLNKRLHVDHDHTTDEIRGLLCSNCNTGIGLLKEDPKILLQAVEYLETKDGE